ncbi:hypothetical protein VNO78_07925 [Psophocarpus tetragonolobus]|uniref:Bulb-type lectin domain-containing protein n=1 Tax=Psophocarpus tetragonolobus TaxID=3891 RepID=A0AAN9T419_PSOTE
MLAFGNVTLSSTLSTKDSDAWLSPSGEFAFGFRQLNGTRASLFMVAIWYDKIPPKTIVWNAKVNESLATTSRGSEVHLTSGGLVLKTREGESIWIAQSNATVSYGTMLDTGNFALVNKNSTFVWESFNHPSDTLLPSQSLELDGKLTSRLADSNYMRGRFQLYFKDGVLLLSPLAWPAQLQYRYYYRINASHPLSRLVATLDFSGVFTQYAHPRSTNGQQGWTIMRYVPNNICTAIFSDYGSGACGYNSYCSMENNRPTCKCPYGYSLVDPTNQFGGCQPNFNLACGVDVQAQPEVLYEMHEFRNFNFPLGDYERIQPYTQQECRQSCLHDCMCALVILSGGDMCWKKRFPLSNGRQLPVNSSQHIVYIKTRINHDFYPHRNRELQPGTNSKKDRAKPILFGSLIVSLVVNSILIAAVALRSVLVMEAGEEEKAILTDWAYDCYMEGRMDVVVEKDEEALFDNGRLQKWIKIGIWCLNEQPEMRPTMGTVMQMLESFVQVPNPPPPFSMHSIS